mgnify:CR=1 FL=1
MDPGTIFIMASGGTIIFGTFGYLIYKIVQTNCITTRVHSDSSASTGSTTSTVAVHLLHGDTNNVV